MVGRTGYASRIMRTLALLLCFTALGLPLTASESDPAS